MPDSLAEGARLFAEKMRQGAYKEAARIKSDYGLPSDMVQDAVLEEYHRIMAKGEFAVAAELARQYGLPSELRNDAALRSFWRKIDSEFYRAAADYAKELELPAGQSEMRPSRPSTRVWSSACPRTPQR